MPYKLPAVETVGRNAHEILDDLIGSVDSDVTRIARDVATGSNPQSSISMAQEGHRTLELLRTLRQLLPLG